MIEVSCSFPQLCELEFLVGGEMAQVLNCL